MNTRLKELRSALGLRQREVAARLGVSVGNVGNWEIGREPIPRARIYQICKEFNVNKDWLVNGSGEMFAAPLPPIDENEVRRRFVLSCFRSLPEESRAAILDALREYVGEKSGSAPASIQMRTENNNGGAVNQSITIQQNQSETSGEFRLSISNSIQSDS